MEAYMRLIPLLMLPLIAAACKFGDDRSLGGQVDSGIDSSLPGAGHLLITEVRSGNPEFIEIWNPTNRDIDLSNYYLSDFGNYWKLPEPPLPPVPADFVARFPAGAMILSDQVITIATREAAYRTAYGAATYALDLNADNAPTRAFPSRIVDTDLADLPTITNSGGDGEFIILFYWDGASDNVKDVDIVMAGISVTGSSNAMQNKMPVDGPDADTTRTPYKPDNGLFGGGMSAPDGASTSYKRRKLETGLETQDGMGNGINGDDETSEQFKASWDGDSAQMHSAPTPGVVPQF